jgi:hypothetical protein
MTANPESTLQQLNRVHYLRTAVQAALRHRLQPPVDLCLPLPGNGDDPLGIRHCRDQLLRYAAEEHRLRERLWHKALHAGAAPVYRWQLRATLQDGTSAVFGLPPQALFAGRDNRCDLILPLPEVSRCHAGLQATAGGLAVRDLQSTNGIAVNGQPVHAALLQAGDRLTLGGVDFVLDDCQPADVVFVA